MEFPDLSELSGYFCVHRVQPLWNLWSTDSTLLEPHRASNLGLEGLSQYYIRFGVDSLIGIHTLCISAMLFENPEDGFHRI